MKITEIQIKEVSTKEFNSVIDLLQNNEKIMRFYTMRKDMFFYSNVNLNDTNNWFTKKEVEVQMGEEDSIYIDLIKLKQGIFIEFPSLTKIKYKSSGSDHKINMIQFYGEGNALLCYITLGE